MFTLDIGNAKNIPMSGISGIQNTKFPQHPVVSSYEMIASRKNDERRKLNFNLKNYFSFLKWSYPFQISTSYGCCTKERSESSLTEL